MSVGTWRIQLDLEHQLWEWIKKFQMTGRLVWSDLVQKGATKGKFKNPK
jgi:hypothetical protein